MVMSGACELLTTAGTRLTQEGMTTVNELEEMARCDVTWRPNLT
jgi:hypothetical protein